MEITIGIGIRVGWQRPNGTVVYTGPLILTDGTETWRIVVRDDEMRWDYVLTELGFDGDEGIDWYNAQSEVLTVIG